MTLSENYELYMSLHAIFTRKGIKADNPDGLG